MNPAAPASGHGHSRKRSRRALYLGALPIALGLFAASPATAQNLPDRPHSVSLGARDAALAVAWEDGSDGGSAITGYQIAYSETTSPTTNPPIQWKYVTHDSLVRSYTIQGLTNGKRYVVHVQARNAVGLGSLSSAVHMNLPDVIPPAATQPGVTAGNAAVDLTWTHSDTNGTAITKWEYDKKPGEGDWEDTWADICETENDSKCPGKRKFTVSSLTNGTAYKFKVRAVNRVGNGTESPESASVTPSTTPAKPGTPTVTGGNRQVALTWTAGGNGGSAITGWKYLKEEGGTWDTNWTAVPNSGASTTTYTVTGLTAGTEYKFKVRAVNANGDGAESDASEAVTPSTTPAAPGKPTVSGADRSVALTWTKGDDGSSTITGWKVLKKTGGTWDTNWTEVPNSDENTTSHTVANLTNGTEYRFKVRAVNVNGDGAESPESEAVTPSTTPPAPNRPTVAARHQAVVLGWSSTGNGGSAITGWKFLKEEGGTWDTNWTEVPNSGANTTSYTVTGLTNSTTYRFKVRAVNANGDGTESAESDPATPGSTTLAAETVAGTTATLKLSGYSGTWSLKGRQSGATCKESLTGTTSDVSGLDMDTAYTYDAYGTGDCSAAVLASVVFTTATTPAAPSQPTVSGGDRQVTLTWSAGGNGGSAITGWKVLKHDGSAWEGTWAAIPNSGANTTRHTVTGLANGTEYKFKVRAVNANGDGAESPESEPVTPAPASRPPTGSGGEETQAEVPPSPSRPSVAARGGQVTLTWSSRGDGGSRITRWQYAYKTDGDYGPWTNIPDSGANTTSFTVTGLTNGRTYRFRVRAVNGMGAGSPSAESAPAMPGDAPFAASKPAATAGYEQVTLVWSSGGDGGIPIAKWQYRMRAAAAEETAASNWTDVPGSGPWTTHTTVTGLTNGTAYRFQLRAVNAAGPGSTSPWSDAVTPVDAAPDFGDARIPDQRWERGVPIAPLTLPEASGGDGALTYALAPALPAGLTFDAATRTVTGTPTDVAEAATWNWTATDSDPTDPDTASLSFLIEVAVAVADQAIMEDTLAAQGRALLTNATGAIGERFRRGNAVAGAGDALRTASRSVGATLRGAAVAEVRSSGRGPGAVSLDAPGGGSTGLSEGSGFGGFRRDDLLRGRSFALQLGGGEDQPGRWTAWGAGAAQRFDGSSVAGSFDGQVNSVFGGLDVRLGEDWLAGAAVSRSWGASDYDATGMGGSRGSLNTALNGIYPYLRRESPGGLEVWAIGGYGRGEAEDLRDGSPAEESGLEMSMGAAGLRRKVRDLGGLELSVVGGAGYLRLTTEDGRRAVDGVSAEISQGRLGLEASRRVGALAPYVRLGGRFDGGDVATGAGLEVTGGMRYGGERLDFEAQGRWLAAHSASGYQEYGGMARLAWRSRPDGGGLRVNLAPRWGAPGSEGAPLGGGEHLLGGVTAGMPPVAGAGGWDPRDQSVSLRSDVGYGFALRRGVLIPAVAYDRGGYGGPRTRFGFAYEARRAAGRDGFAPVAGPRWGLVAGWEPATAAAASDYRMEVRYSRPF